MRATITFEPLTVTVPRWAEEALRECLAACEAKPTSRVARAALNELVDDLCAGEGWVPALREFRAEAHATPRFAVTAACNHEGVCALATSLTAAKRTARALAERSRVRHVVHDLDASVVVYDSRRAGMGGQCWIGASQVGERSTLARGVRAVGCRE